MIVQPERLLLWSALLLLVGIGASKLSTRLGVPALLLFLVAGMLAGSEGPGGIPFDDPAAAQFLGTVALALILFAGGFDTDPRSIPNVLWQGVSLATLGVLFTAVLLGVFASYVLGIPLLHGLLLGAIVSSTDAAAVFSVLRSQRIGLKGTTAPLLEFESGSNDPMAVFLTTAVLGLIGGDAASPWLLLRGFLVQMIVGAALGWMGGRLAIWAINRLNLESDGLYPVFSLAAVLLTFGGTALLGGNGFLAVYVCGLVMAGGDFLHKRTLQRFHEGVAWLMQIAMFLVLGLLVFPSRLWPVAGVSLALAAFLILVARPAAVLLSLAFARLRFRQKLLISWVGLRGAVPIVLATFPYLAGVPEADVYFNVVFFTVLTSVLAQGTTIPAAARLLRLEVPLAAKRRYPLEFVPATKTDSDLLELTVAENAAAAGKRVMDVRLPGSALIVLIGRGEDFLAPRGATVLEAGDSLLVLLRKTDADRVRALIEGSYTGSSSG